MQAFNRLLKSFLILGSVCEFLPFQPYNHLNPLFINSILISHRQSFPANLRSSNYICYTNIIALELIDVEISKKRCKFNNLLIYDIISIFYTLPIYWQQNFKENISLLQKMLIDSNWSLNWFAINVIDL